MAYRLQDALWFCQVGGHLIFLNVHEDRYFRLPLPLEDAFTSYMQGELSPETASLIEQKLASDLPPNATPKQPHGLESPRHSALEQVADRSSIGFSVLLEVAATITSVLLRLKMRPLEEVLVTMQRYRERHAPAMRHLGGGRPGSELIDTTNAFNIARLYTPIEPSCLLDSIALATFMAKRHIRSTVIFGVTCNPFSAHSWVQVGDLVLNDTVGNANSYTPIGMF